MSNKIKLHLGCGNVYLDGYINVDFLKQGVTRYASMEPKIVEQYKTTIDQYYKKPFQENGTDITLVDFADDIRNLSVVKAYVENNNLDIESIVAIQVLEHFTEEEVPKIIKLWADMLCEGGTLSISVPDMIQTCKMLVESRSDEEFNWASRLIYGSQKDIMAFHKSSFNQSKLRDLMEEAGLIDIHRKARNIHCYPSLHMTGEKWAKD